MTSLHDPGTRCAPAVRRRRHRLLDHRRPHRREARRRPLGRCRPGDQLGTEQELATEIDVSFTDRVIAPFSERLVGVGRSMIRADTATKIKHRLDIAGNPPAWDVNRIIGTKVLATRRRSAAWASSTCSLAADVRSPARCSARVGFCAIGLHACPTPAEERRRQARGAHAQLAAGRDRPAHDLRRGRPRVRRGRGARREEHRRAARAGVRTTAPGDAAGHGPRRGHAGHGRTHHPARAQVLLPGHGAGRQPRHPDRARAADPELASCGSSAASAPRRRRRRCRSRSSSR